MKNKTTIQPKTIGVQPWMTQPRGCGKIIAGGTYISVPSGFSGTPIWTFLIDPTVPIPEDFGLSDIGMLLKSRGQVNNNGQEIFDLYDHIGSSGYPNVSDWILEVQQLGLHQKVNPNLLCHLVPESYYFAVHSKASFTDPTIAYEERLIHPNYPKCPVWHPQHQQYPAGDKIGLGTCPGLFFSNVINGVSATSRGLRDVDRKMPAFEYQAFSPTGVEGETVSAIFFKMPIGRIASFLIYSDEQSNTHELALKELEKLDERLQRVKIVSLDKG